jgi:hypothetical protein
MPRLNIPFFLIMWCADREYRRGEEHIDIPAARTSHFHYAFKGQLRGTGFQSYLIIACLHTPTLLLTLLYNLTDGHSFMTNIFNETSSIRTIHRASWLYREPSNSNSMGQVAI